MSDFWFLNQMPDIVKWEGKAIVTERKKQRRRRFLKVNRYIKYKNTKIDQSNDKENNNNNSKRLNEGQI